VHDACETAFAKSFAVLPLQNAGRLGAADSECWTIEWRNCSMLSSAQFAR